MSCIKAGTKFANNDTYKLTTVNMQLDEIKITLEIHKEAPMIVKYLCFTIIGLLNK